MVKVLAPCTTARTQRRKRYRPNERTLRVHPYGHGKKKHARYGDPRAYKIYLNETPTAKTTKIAIAHDHRPYRDLIPKALELSGYEVTIQANHSKALLDMLHAETA